MKANQLEASRLIVSSAKGALVLAAEEALNVGKERLFDLSSSIGGAIFASLTGNLVMSITLGFLKHFLATEAGIGRLEQQLTTLLQGPLRTAIEEFGIITQLEPKGEDEFAFRAQRALQAHAKLGEAFALSDDSMKPAIMLLRGLTALLIPGGGQEATLHLDAYCIYCLREADKLEGEAVNLESRASQLSRKLGTMKRPSGPGVGGGFTGSAIALEHLEYREIEFDSNRLSSEAMQKRADSQDLRLCAAITRELAGYTKNGAQLGPQADA